MKNRICQRAIAATSDDKEESFVVVVDGFFSVMWLWEEQLAAVAVLGSSFSEAQEELLCQYFRRVVLLFDGDDAGRRVSDDCLVRLGRRLRVTAISLPDGVQPDQLRSDEILKALTS